MELAKLIIRVETGEDEFNKEVKVLFNPNKIGIQKTAKWELVPGAERDVPQSQFTHGEPATLSLELLCDTYEGQTDVRQHTDEIFALTTVEEHGELHRPPLCKLEWGKFNFNDFQWVLESLNQTFTLFLADGTPARATLACSFKQWRSDEVEARLLNRQSADVPKTRTVRRGDTLSSLASREYKDPTLWRAIAEANNIDNPRQLVPGQVLAIPILRSRQPSNRR